MSLRRLLLGRVLSDSEAESERIGVAAGVPILGLDALASAAYGPEAALTILLPLGASGLHLATPIAAVIHRAARRRPGVLPPHDPGVPTRGTRSATTSPAAGARR